MKRILLLVFCLLGCLGAMSEEKMRIVYGPYLQNMGEREVTIVWVTDKDAVSWVEIAPDDKMGFHAAERPRFYQSEAGRRNVGRLHTVRVTGLQPGTTYRYDIYSTEVVRNEPRDVRYGWTTYGYRSKIKVPMEFTTADNSRSSVSFTVVNDIHADSAKLGILVGDVRKDKNDFVIFNGDMLSNTLSEKQIFDGFMATAISRFASTVPMYYVRGNHETRGVFTTEFPKYFPTPTGNLYYTFRQGPVFFIVLDSGEDKLDSDVEYFGLADYDNYRREQAVWLEGVVASDEFRAARYRVVIVHMPPYGVKRHGMLHVGEVFVPVLNRAGIDLMLSGHTHRYIFIPEGEGPAKFPILINSNVDAVKSTVDDKGIHVNVVDMKGRAIHTFDFAPKRL